MSRLGEVLEFLIVIGSILCGILKFCGILLLGLLALALLILIFTLFVPVRYRVYLAYNGQIEVQGKISWLFSLLSIPIRQGEEGVEICVKIFGFRIGASGKKDSSKKRKSKKQRKRRSGKAAQESKESDSRKQSALQQTDRTEQVKIEENQPNCVKSLEEHGEQKTVKESLEKNIQEDEMLERKRKRSIFLLFRERLGRINDNRKRLVKRFVTGWKHMWQRLCQGRVKFDRVHAFLGSDTVTGCWGLAKELLGYLWRHSRPRKRKGEILFGTGDPCSTGQILGGLGICYIWLGKDVQITPDFSRQVFEGFLEMKGRIRMIHLVRVGKKVWFDKEWRQFRKELSQLKEDL